MKIYAKRTSERNKVVINEDKLMRWDEHEKASSKDGVAKVAQVDKHENCAIASMHEKKKKFP
jgi:hypothetical protein